MYCSKCGAKNPDEHQFCEKCGAPLMKKQQEASTEEPQASPVDANASRKKRRTMGGIAIIAVVVVCIIAIVVNMGQQVSPEYTEKIAEADRYLEELDYDKAETAYLEAIDIEPKVDEAYLKLADTYVVQEKYEDALEILEKGQENAGGKKIIAMLEKVTPYSSYYDFLEAEVIPEVGLAQVDETFYWGESSGLVSALIKDINADEIPELITVTYGATKYSTITMSVYTSEDGEVTLVDEYVENDIPDEDSFGRQYDVVVKEHEGKTYLYIYGYLPLHASGAHWFIRAYAIEENEILSSCEVGYYSALEVTLYYLNGETIARFDNENPGINYDKDAAIATSDKAYDVFTEALMPYGLENKLARNEYGTLNIYGYDSDDPTEVILSYLEAGEFDEYNGVNFAAGDIRFLSDYTDLRSNLD